MVVESPPVPVEKRPKDLQPFNATGLGLNTPLGKQQRKPSSFIGAGSVEQSTSPLNTTNPSPLRKRMAFVSQDDFDFKFDRVCELVGGVQWYGNVTGSRMEDDETKLWSIKYDNDEEEEVTLQQLIMRKKRYTKHKQYDTEAKKKLPATTTKAPTLPVFKKK